MDNQNPSPSPTPKHPTPKEVIDIAKMISEQQESDRGCVIFGAAILEDKLELLLRSYCRQDPQIIKRVVAPLFQGYAPLSTFSAKIQISFALGLIAERDFKALDLLRKLRNQFAHDKDIVSFQSIAYKPLADAFLASTAESPRVTQDEWERITQSRPSARRVAFCINVAYLLGRLDFLVENRRQRRVSR